MPFAVSCSSCGARFSVPDELYQKRFAGRIVTVRCRHCQKVIRLDASEPPSAAKAGPPAPPRRQPANPIPHPPRPGERQPTRGVVALAPGLLDSSAKARRGMEGVFETPAPSAPPRSEVPRSESVLDLTVEARSEPALSEGPPLAHRSHKSEGQNQRVSEELLELRGAPGTVPALMSPALPTFESATESVGPPQPPFSGEQGRPDTKKAPASAAPENAGLRAWPLLLGLLLIAVGVAVWLTLTERAAAPVPARSETEPTEGHPPDMEPIDEPLKPAAPEPEPQLEPAAPTVAGPSGDEPPATDRPAPPNLPAPMADSAMGAGQTGGAPGSQPPSTSPVFRPRPQTAPAGTGPFDRDAAAAALGAAATRATACRQEGDPSGTANVTVTFAPSGRITSATVSGPPFAGSKTGGCIAATMRSARVPGFAGDKVTVAKTVVIR